MTTRPTNGPIHTWFSLSYTNYLVLHRTLMQSMPDEWQTKFVGLLDELESAFEHVPQAEAYDVTAGEDAILDELGPVLLEKVGITENFYDEPVPEDLGPFDLAEWKAEHEKASPSYHRVSDGAELDGQSYVFIPGVDPVPHYNRGRTYIEPRTAAEVRKAGE